LKPRRFSVAVYLLASLLAAVTGCTALPPARTAYRPAALPGSAAARNSANTSDTVVRGQDPGLTNRMTMETPGSHGYLRQGMPISQAPHQTMQSPQVGVTQAPYYQAQNQAPPMQPVAAQAQYNPANYPSAQNGSVPYAQPPYTQAQYVQGQTVPTLPPPATQPQPLVSPEFVPPASPLEEQPYIDIDPTMTTPVDVYVQETQTGRFMFGAGVNSDAGVTGQIVVDERNFDLFRLPTSFRDFVDGTAFRGAGQGFRLEAMPGTQVQRYLVSFTEPYLFNTPVSLNLSAFLYDRRYFDWDEQRLGGRLALGYRLTHDLSISGAIRAEGVEISNPRELVPDLVEVLGDNELYSGRLSLTHDTRDIPFFPSEGHLIEMSFEQIFGDFDYPRAELDLRKYFLVRERPDGSGRHTLGCILQLGVSGAQTPLFENYFAGGYSTLRGFEFRGASPLQGSVRVGGELRLLGSFEYTFPLTADDMLKGAFFCDYGTVEEDLSIRGENFRVSPGFGVRISIPALGPAPLAFDFGFPVAKADGDAERMFNFFFGVGR
jgi:outer membrane protein insertion porin family